MTLVSRSPLAGSTAPLLRVALFALAASGIAGCVGTAGRVHVSDEPVTDIEASDVDLRAMARQMAAAIIELPAVAEADGSLYIAFHNIENRTLTVDFDSYNLLSKIRQDLIEYSGGKLQFLDKKMTDAILAERDAKRSGSVTSSKRENMPGLDYFLTGYAYSMRKSGQGGKMQGYHRYSFRLTDAETSIVVWEDDYEFKKYGRRGTAYR
ncbi:MAG: penicillin-binding protein activator LpoB [Planctomycetes bacterium]|nr:penicillin-binding protein activator LpoB [Planctomycetota bacterium]